MYGVMMWRFRKIWYRYKRWRYQGPAGIFRALRTIPVMLISKDIDQYCPKAIVLNYTNPMAMLCRAMQSEYPNLAITGLLS